MTVALLWHLQNLAVKFISEMGLFSLKKKHDGKYCMDIELNAW